MGRLLIVFCISCLLVMSATGQHKSPLPAEELEAITLAATFSNRYDTTKRLDLLIDDFFVSDFKRRLKFCWTGNDCHGEDLDFWMGNEELAISKPSPDDYYRHYVAMIDVIYLGINLYDQLAKEAGKTPETYAKEGERVLSERLSVVLKKDAKGIFTKLLEETGDQGLCGLKSLKAFRKRINEIEDLADGLRIILENQTPKSKRTDTASENSLVPSDFWAREKVSKRRFFDYPVGTRLIRVSEKDYKQNKMPFWIDMVSENGRLKIVAVYPPMD